MPAKFIPLFDLKVSPNARKQVSQVLASGWLTTGSKAHEFEQAVCKRIRVRNAVAVSSATAGLQTVLEALGVAGREVITTPFTFVATLEAVIRAGGQPILADVDPETLCIDPDEVVRKISSKTAAVVPVDIAGRLAEYATLKTVCDHAKLPLIADASHSFGGTLKRKSTAQWTDAAIYSCHATKNLTSGEGGLVTTRHKMLADHARLLSRHAMTRNAHDRRKLKQWEYDVVDLGLKANMSDIHAAVGLGQLSGLDKHQQRREAIADRYEKNLSDLADLVDLPETEPGHRPAWHLYIIRLELSNLKISRDRFIRLMRDRGVECGVHYKPVYDMSYYQAYGYQPAHFPNCTFVARRVVSLPMFPELKLSEVDRVSEAVRDIVLTYSR